MSNLKYLLFALFLQGCFPISIPPNLEKGRLMEAQKFKRKLPNHYGYIFTDTKDANEFYYYVSHKFPPNQEGDSESNVPVLIRDKKYYVSFYEAEKKLKVVNLIPSMINEIADNKNLPIQLDEPPIVRDGTWYIVLTIQDVNFKDALNPSYSKHASILDYVKKLHNEYLATRNYKTLSILSD